MIVGIGLLAGLTILFMIAIILNFFGFYKDESEQRKLAMFMSGFISVGLTAVMVFCS